MFAFRIWSSSKHKMMIRFANRNIKMFYRNDKKMLEIDKLITDETEYFLLYYIYFLHSHQRRY